MAESQKTTAQHEQVDFHGGTVIGKDGSEIAITEEMVRDAILKLDPEAFADQTQSKH